MTLRQLEHDGEVKIRIIRFYDNRRKVIRKDKTGRKDKYVQKLKYLIFVQTVEFFCIWFCRLSRLFQVFVENEEVDLGIREVGDADEMYAIRVGRHAPSVIRTDFVS